MPQNQRLIAGILLGLLVLPLFFTIQIVLVLLGWPQFTLDALNADYILRATPALALIAPPARVLILALAFALLARRSRWLPAAALVDMVIHITGWLSIIANPSFTLPTGFISFGLQAVLMYTLIQSGYFQLRKR